MHSVFVYLTIKLNFLAVLKHFITFVAGIVKKVTFVKLWTGPSDPVKKIVKVRFELWMGLFSGTTFMREKNTVLYK